MIRTGDAQWQGVGGTRHKFYVYSAYCDDRDRPLVRVIAATQTKKSDKVRFNHWEVHQPNFFEAPYFQRIILKGKESSVA